MKVMYTTNAIESMNARWGYAPPAPCVRCPRGTRSLTATAAAVPPPRRSLTAMPASGRTKPPVE